MDMMFQIRYLRVLTRMCTALLIGRAGRSPHRSRLVMRGRRGDWARQLRSGRRHDRNGQHGDPVAGACGAGNGRAGRSARKAMIKFMHEFSA